MTSRSYVVNEALRNGAVLSKEDAELIESLDKALDKIPSYEGNLQRSLYFYSEKEINEFMNDYEIGKSIIYKEYLSTSNGKVYNPDGQVQIFIENAKKGKDISNINNGETEVLYKRDSSFIVKNIVENDGVYYILLGENDE